MFILSKLYSDNFQRVNNPLAAPWATDLHGDAGLKIVSSVCVPETDGGDCIEMYSTSSALPNDQYATATIGTLTGASLFSNVRMLIRGGDTDSPGGMPSMNGYSLLVASTGVWHVQETGGNILSGSGLVIASGDQFTLAIQSVTVYVFHNGVQIGSIVTDGVFTSGVTALGLADNGTPGQSTITYWEVGAVLPAGSGGSRRLRWLQRMKRRQKAL